MAITVTLSTKQVPLVGRNGRSDLPFADPECVPGGRGQLYL